MDVFEKQVVNLYQLLNTRASISETLSYILNTFRSHIPCSRIMIALTDGSNIYSHTVVSDYSPLLKEGYTIGLSQTSLQTVLKSNECRIINNYKTYLKQHPKSAPTRLILQEGINSSLACPLILNNSCIGVLLFSSKQQDAYTKEHASMSKLIAGSIALTLERNLIADNLILPPIISLARLVEAKCSDNRFHIERIQNYSKILAEALAGSEKYKNIIDRQFIADIYKFSPLHDIGKIGIADGLLLKPGSLSAEEFEVVKKHVIFGAELLRKAGNDRLVNGRNYFDMAIQIAESHHEKYDSSGYPHGLAGDSIPLAARIVAVADVFDALTSRRVYKNALDVEASMQIIDKESGKSFDPDVVAALNDHIEQVIKIYKKYNEGIDLDRR